MRSSGELRNVPSAYNLQASFNDDGRRLNNGVEAKVLLFFDLVFTKPSARQYRFDIRNHLRMTTRVRDRVTMIKTKLVGMLAHNVLDSTGFAPPTRFCPGPADGWYVR